MSLLLGLLLSLFPPALFLGLYYLIKIPTKWRSYLWIVVLALSLLAFSYVPAETTDLYRYRLIAERVSHLDFFDAVTNGFEEGLIIINLLFWIAGKTKAVGLLPAFSVAVVYGVAGYITCDTAEAFERQDRIPWTLFIQFLLLPFFNIILNVRNVAAFSLVLLAVYRDIIKRKLNVITIAIYLSACMIHISALSLILLRIIIPIAKRHLILVTLLAAFLSSGLTFLYNNVGLFGNNNIFTRAIYEAYHYTTDTYAQTGYGAFYRSYWWNNVNFYVCMAFALITLITIVRKKFRFTNNDVGEYSEDKHERMAAYVYMICVMIFASNVFNAPHYWRYAVALSVGIGYFFISYGIKLNVIKLLPFGYLMLSMAFLFLQVIRFVPSLISSGSLIDFLWKNPFYIVFEMFT